MKVTAHLTRDGGIDNSDIKGSLTLIAASDADGNCQVQLSVSDTLGFSFQTHPKIDKRLYDTSKILALKVNKTKEKTDFNITIDI